MERASMEHKLQDFILPFSFSKVSAKGKFISLNSVSKEILRVYSSHKSINKVFLETISLAVLISSNFKIDSIFKLQINCYNAIIKAILVDIKSNGDIRATISINSNEVSLYKDKDIPFSTIVGEGYMLFSLEQRRGVPYQTVIKLDKNSMEECALSWFKISEQIPSFLKLFSNVQKNTASSIFVQAIPNYGGHLKEENSLISFETLKILTATLREEEALNRNATDIIFNLYHEFEPIVYDYNYLQYKCSCSKEKMLNVLALLSEEEVEEIRAENFGIIEIKCEFCGDKYIF